ncbi:MAG TPA: SDR family NAD(P)-dependent oxidoreductase [Chloroflexota bacterium]|nr:SDR family NAD(P)-dependent oxidoreductase [Chloroflexota bacterium]
MKVIVTGGAGFIGSNAAARYLARGDQVVVVDNLSRKGADENLNWLRARGGELTLARVDIRDADAVAAAFRAHADAEVVLHLAGQVAVTTSVADPRTDFEINALGSFNVLEAARTLPRLRALLCASTNKVYGGLEDVAVVERDGRYVFRDLPDGVAETRPLDFHSPYGCSKGTADQYTIDYARIYGLPTVTFRQSTIYGPRQLGVEDQGWLAWFAIAGLLGKPLTIYGDGKQVRDMLHVDDLLNAYDAAIQRIDSVKGRVYNVGGGPTNTLAIIEGLRHVERHLGRSLNPRFDDWRPGDQRVFIADISRARRELDWWPRIAIEDGVGSLLSWVQEHRPLFSALFG